MARTPKTRSQADQAPLYPIRAVSLMTGVSIDTLRVWERRYQAVTPMRDARGRLYTDADVRRITLLREAVAGGHAIGRVAGLETPQLEKLTLSAATHSTVAAGQGRRDPASAMQADRDAILDALDRFDGTAVETALARAAALLHPPDLLRDVVTPLLREVGDRWHAGQIGIAQEHLLSASVRNVLGSLLRLHRPVNVSEALVFSTPSGERHEFGTLGAAVLAASAGLGAIYLGPDTPADSLEAVVRQAHPQVVVIGVTGADGVATIDRDVMRLAERLDPRVELWIGGPDAVRVSKTIGRRALPVPTYEALTQQLSRVASRL